MKTSFKENLKKNSPENLKVFNEIVASVKVGMLSTFDPQGNLVSRPMYLQELDGQGQMWFFTSSFSQIAEHINFNSKVHVTFENPQKDKYLSASGTGSFVTDRSRMEELWSPSLKSWFREGLDTKGICLLKVHLDSAEYWDTPHSPVVKMVGIVKAMVSDEPYTPGRHNHVDLHQ
jgi:general stress protein 26